MWKFLLFIAAVVAWSDSAQADNVYLTTLGGWDFFKVPAVGAMTNSNVIATCGRAGMAYPCWWSRYSCNYDWDQGCIKFDDGGHCDTLIALSVSLCGHEQAWYCQPLFDTFVYYPNLSWPYHDDSAGGLDYENVQSVDHGQNVLHGSHYFNKYALCAAKVGSHNGGTDVFTG
ncbi:uncharacterized protein LOC118414672 [Branchiostoma floridae]|uniref:Uncharacterized protein LOC118414672 n=2 Tax=Branchiostoma floridae TaxID=7739 RepID=A0A9J7MNM7_BRAFL|nr:uncharacterized protein LOC118414672 [Branchiostoma floridae]